MNLRFEIGYLDGNGRATFVRVTAFDVADAEAVVAAAGLQVTSVRVVRAIASGIPGDGPTYQQLCLLLGWNERSGRRWAARMDSIGRGKERIYPMTGLRERAAQRTLRASCRADRVAVEKT